MNYPIFLFFGLAPSLIWLSFYLRKDVHPESNSQIIKVFIYGMLIALPTALIEFGATQGFKMLEVFNLPSILIIVLSIFIGAAFVEEFLKYWVVKESILKNPEFDEPLDAMLYMIIVALGFAALENILFITSPDGYFILKDVLTLSVFRFLGATFLHTLCSGLVGFFIALSCLNPKNRIKLTSIGLVMATILHGLYNFSIIKIEERYKFVLPVLLLAGLAVFISFGFKKLRSLASVCKVK